MAENNNKTASSYFITNQNERIVDVAFTMRRNSKQPLDESSLPLNYVKLKQLMKDPNSSIYKGQIVVTQGDENDTEEKISAGGAYFTPWLIKNDGSSSTTYYADRLITFTYMNEVNNNLYLKKKELGKYPYTGVGQYVDGNQYIDTTTYSERFNDYNNNGFIESTTSNFAHIEGVSNKTAGDVTHLEGAYNFSYKKSIFSHVEGSYNIIYENSTNSHIEGTSNKINADANGIHVEGLSNTGGGIGSHVGGYKSSSTGNYSFAHGNNIESTGQSSVAFGEETKSNSKGSFTSGFKTVVKDGSSYSHAEGIESTLINSEGSHTEGKGTKMNNSKYGHAEGVLTTVSSDGGHAEGYSTKSTSQYSHSEGNTTTASGLNSHSEGNITTASGLNSHSEGYKTLTAASNSHSEGSNNNIDNQSESSHSEGDSNNITASKYSHIEGTYNTINSGTGIHVEGTLNKDIKGTYLHVEGGSNKVEGIANNNVMSHLEGSENTLRSSSYSHTEGSNNVIESSTYSHSEGKSNNIYTSNYSHSEGINNNIYANSDGSHVEGNTNSTNSKYSHVEGYNNTVLIDSEGAHAEGKETRASGNYSHTEGIKSLTNGEGAHAEGYNTKSIGDYSHSEGEGNIVNGKGSHAEGHNTKVGFVKEKDGDKPIITNYAHAEGEYTYAFGSYSHAEGSQTRVEGSASHVEGLGNIVSGSYSLGTGFFNTTSNNAEIAFGTYNRSYTTASGTNGTDITTINNEFARLNGKYIPGRYPTGIDENNSSTVAKYDNSYVSIFTIGNGGSGDIREENPLTTINKDGKILDAGTIVKESGRHNIMDIRKNGQMYYDGGMIVGGEIVAPMSYSYVASLGPTAYFTTIMAALLTQPEYYRPTLRVNFNGDRDFSAGTTFDIEVGSYVNYNLKFTGNRIAYDCMQHLDPIYGTVLGNMLGYTKGITEITYETCPTYYTKNSTYQNSNLRKCTINISRIDNGILQGNFAGKVSLGKPLGGGKIDAFAYNPAGATVSTPTYMKVINYGENDTNKNGLLVGTEDTYTLLKTTSYTWSEASQMYFQQLAEKGTYIGAAGTKPTEKWNGNETFHCSALTSIRGRYKIYWGTTQKTCKEIQSAHDRGDYNNGWDGLVKGMNKNQYSSCWSNYKGDNNSKNDINDQTINKKVSTIWVAFPAKLYGLAKSSQIASNYIYYTNKLGTVGLDTGITNYDDLMKGPLQGGSTPLYTYLTHDTIGNCKLIYRVVAFTNKNGTAGDNSSTKYGLSVIRKVASSTDNDFSSNGILSQYLYDRNGNPQSQTIG